ncbi:GlcNAc-PI de-N-acetylase [Methylobacterium sp. Leaf399]|uniref:PIG-L deacetylase family protein n=1 Tax=unclassified Methylobacterium TaxID=2615210 RepID=UPI0006FCBA26|nr:MULTISPECIES: PIG-L family deacetylase [unclassified Methylobacterium]KQP52711.1 GlcNAc-PI de-N-acetylase [Methylobacterium sp. Leaf108]KQT11892.1 GlcNAc-PI de-N-acetylase [Methylobacterium sp. Leaf399]
MQAAAFLAAATALPFGDLPTLLGDGGLVVVAPHADDESLGCGGLIAEAVREGRDVRVVIVSDGAGSHTHSVTHPPDRLRALRETEAQDAVAILGLPREAVSFLRLPDAGVPSTGPEAQAAADAIAALARDCDAGAICVTWAHDPHCDHTAAAAIATLAQRQLPEVGLYAYPVWGWTLPADREVGAAPQGWRLDVSAHSAAKRRAILAHRSQTSDLIADDPSGFRLAPEMIDRFCGPFEIFILLSPRIEA